MSFIVIGKWNGKTVHQEIVQDDSLKEKYQDIHCIMFTDGTGLEIEVHDTLPIKLGYKSLLDKAVRVGMKGYINVMNIK